MTDMHVHYKTKSLKKKLTEYTCPLEFAPHPRGISLCSSSANSTCNHL